MLYKSLLLLICFFIVKSTKAQDSLYPKILITKEFLKARRQALREKMPANSIAVFFSASEKIRSNDVEFDFHQDPDFFYLTGFNEPDAVLIVFKDTQQIKDYKGDECLFVQARDPKKETWTGKKAGQQGAPSITGIEAIYLNTSFNLDTIKKQHPILDQKLLSFYMKELREIKSEEELRLMRKAIVATCEAQVEVAKFTEALYTEYQVQAVLEYVFKEQGCEAPAFPSIVGSGENSCILHYTSNRKTLQSTDLVVVDIGAEYQGYAADVTRTLPVSGHFSPNQKQLYELVMQAQQAGIDACQPGAAFDQPHKAAKAVIVSGLLKLGIIKQEKDYHNFFMHGTSHYLGLDVHDVGTYKPLQKGNVITVEPGIYIPAGSACDPKWWNIGIRIEDDILITATGNEVLSKLAPRSVAEIETLMQKKSKFNK
jgi:Xaa-Pro aminopeptidase